MYTRIVELTTKPGKAPEVSKTINDKVLPILKKQTGFVDEAVLLSDTESTRVLGLSFWNKREVPNATTGSNIPRSTKYSSPCSKPNP
jgi:hypothetical protein